MNHERYPDVFIAAGVLFGAVIIAELVATAALPTAGLNIVVIANALSAVPFVAVLVLGGYRLRGGEFVPPARYPRIGGWSLGGLVFFGGFFTIIALTTQTAPLARIGVIRWGVSVGAGAGMLVGLFEARAIDRAVATERSQVRAGELQRQNERLKEFANIIAHDIRNPLNVATGNLELARGDDGNGKLGTVADALDRVEQILEQTLTLARSGQVIGDPVAVDLESLGHRCWSHVETPAAELQLDDPPTVRADADRVEHLLENLFRNAVEHGRDDVTVRVGRLAGGFYVEDDGPGIPVDEREAVLEAGYTTGKGTGFGLAIVAQIAHAHGWQLTIAEGADGGARFEFTDVEVVDPAPEAGTAGGQVFV
jgi:signal transduction histidine kinase